jgi:hypothetical protein
MRKIALGICLSLSALTLLLPGGSEAKGPPKTPLSTLSPGDFERQLDLPLTEPLPAGSDLEKAAEEAYAKLPFSVGERIRFAVTYLGVKAGVAEAIVQKPVKWKEGWAHRVTGEVKNADWYSWMINLHDSVETIFDATPAMNPLRFYINQQEPVSFRQSKLIEFDVAEKRVRQTTKRKERKEKRQQFPLGVDTKDAFAALFYFRSNVGVGQGREGFQFPVFTSEKNWTGKAKLVDREKMKVEGTEIDTDVYTLETQFGHLMEQQGSIKLWVSRDERRLPVFVEAKLRFGYIKVALREWRQGKVTPGKTKFPAIGDD